MKKYSVECAVRNAAQIAGYEPYSPYETFDLVHDYIYAETEEDAIELAIDYLVECTYENDYDCNIEIKNDEITIFDDDGVAVEQYYNFITTEKHE
jgi:hypothetical protein